MAHVATLILLFPLGGFLFILLNGRSMSERQIGVVGTGAVAASFVLAVITFVLLLHRSSREVPVHLFSWITVGSLHVPAALLVDPLSITMCLFVTGISALIHLYSTGYMHGEKDYRKFFLYLNLFVFSMLLLVLANNLVLTFVGWEGVGLCSYWLVSYYFDRDSAASAGKKAFIYNRIGDVGMLIAMFLLFSRLHTLNYLTIFAKAGTLSPTIATLTVLALLLAATGKSAQIPPLQLAPRRHGRSDARLGAHPRGHHGDRGGLPSSFACPRSSPCRRRTNDHCRHRWRDRLRGRDHRHVPKRHQEGARLLHRLPDWLHGARGRGRGVHRGDFLNDQSRLLQGAALPRVWFGHPLTQRRAGHAKDGRPRQVPAAHLPDVSHRMAHHLGHSTLRRLLVER